MNEDLKAHLQFFGELGIDGVRLEPEWRGRSGADRSTPRQESHPTVPVLVSEEEALEAIRADGGADCSRCKLHALGRTQVVFGVGNPNADLMFVGGGWSEYTQENTYDFQVFVSQQGATSPSDNGRVLAQNPPGGGQQPKGSGVTLTVGKFPP